MTKQIHALLTLLTVFSLSCCFAQNNIEGIVLDAGTKQPIVYAYITIKDKPLVTITNADGYFKFQSGQILSNDTLIITHINYSSVKMAVHDYYEKQNGKILLNENTIALKEIEVKAQEDDQIFEEIVNQSKKSLNLPLSADLYYRELVRENKSYNKFSDALMTVCFEKEKDDINLKVNQCRVIRLPKEEDDAFELITLLKIDLVLGLEYIDFLNRFRGDRKKDYHFYSQEGNSFDDFYLIRIEPKIEASREDDKRLFYATIKADRNKNITEVEIKQDSLCQFKKSILGWTFEFGKDNMSLNFKKTGDLYYLSHVRMDVIIDMSTKKIKQKENFINEFLVMDIKPVSQPIEKKDRYKKSSLYKHGNKYDRPFWKEINMPVFTAEEVTLLNQLENSEKEKK